MSLSNYFFDELKNFYETWLVHTKIIQKHQYYVNVASWIFAVNLVDRHYEVEVVLCVLISVKLEWTPKLRFVCSTSEEKICFNPLLHLLWHHIVKVNILFHILCAKYNGNYLFCSHCLSARSKQSS
jgi:hypothetical protein